MLKGFNYPLTPKGMSTLNPSPPWYYSADFLNIEFWSDPSAVAALLPTGLRPRPRRAGTKRRAPQLPGGARLFLCARNPTRRGRA